MRGRLVGLLGSLVLLVVAGACSRSKEGAQQAGGSDAGGTQAAAQVARVKLALNWVPEPEFGGFYAARDQGAFKRQGLEVEILGGGAGVPVLQMVATGQVEFGIVGADELLTARARGVDLLPLFAVYQTSPQAIMVHAARGAKSIQDVLASGTIALEPGLPYAAFLRKKYGFDKVKVVPYDGGVAQFVTNKDFAQQCFITSEPIAARKQGADPVVFLVADEGFNPYTAVVVTRRQLWKEQPERVKGFVAAVREGWRTYLDNPAPANAVMGKLNTTLDAETFAAAAQAQKPLIETEETRARGLGSMSRERWETLGRQLAELGLIEKAPAVDEFLLPELTQLPAKASP
ncbi:NitT/TauT family transport system substrate-binding protein [Archangium gephyra]|uniref:Thiamine pyrimidine synthase n=1 Tax=Archangium gephyra TaxID=48 RepID=A0AAC8TF38_9BACT|nr:ABC transporter substrate-binding protein [Archangium gephyra]AKJ03540.1 Hydroxymethylpyrimidine ABC transporter, substrate-binding component [Archangium gephyra]REG22675.1 NitT/TauT family transport system substrate-binding protein [Archangium gephyra]